YKKVGPIAHRPGGLVGVPIAGDDQKAIGIAEKLIREMGFEPVLVGGLAMGKYLLPGTPLAEEHSPAELRQIAAGGRGSGVGGKNVSGADDELDRLARIVAHAERRPPDLAASLAIDAVALGWRQ